ncbi:MAG: hypothetical protein ACRYFX_09320 [Janthinobacterium lividum]
MNGYTLANHFRKLRPSFPFSALEADLFYELVALCNERSWPTEFQYSNPLLCATLGISEKSLISARNRLKQAGLLEFTSGHKRSPTVYRFLDPDAEIPLPQVSKNGSKSDRENDSTSDSTSDSPINKEKTKRKTKPPAAAGEVRFSDFWQAFDKKEDKHKCSQKWATLTAAEQAAAMAALPAYLAAKPIRQYRKNPLTWLNGQCWKDELSPDNSRPAPATPVANDPPTRPAPDLNEEFLAAQQARADAEIDEHFARYAVA